MESNNFITLSHNESKKFLFGIKMIPEKVMDRFTDSFIISIEKNLHHWDKYNIIFKKRCSNDVSINSYVLTKKTLKSYIDFLQDFAENFDSCDNNTCSVFPVDNQGEITLKVLHSTCLKLSSTNLNGESSFNLFYVLKKNELLIYIKKLKALYSGKEIDSYMSLLDIHFLTKKEKDSLYINTLFILADSSLDLKDKKSFNIITNEILKMTK